MAYRDPPRVAVQLEIRTIIDLLVGDSKAPGRNLSESTGLRSHAASVRIDRPFFALASGLKVVTLLVASRAAEFAKPWKSKGSAALALPSVIQHSPVQKLCECQDRPADFRARERVEKRLVALLVVSRAGELAKPWKSEGSAALALPSVIEHSLSE